MTRKRKQEPELPPEVVQQASQFGMVAVMMQMLQLGRAEGGIVSITFDPIEPALVDQLGEALTEAIEWVCQNSESECPTGAGPDAPLARWARAAALWKEKRAKLPKRPAPTPEGA